MCCAPQDARDCAHQLQSAEAEVAELHKQLSEAHTKLAQTQVRYTENANVVDTLRSDVAGANASLQEAQLTYTSLQAEFTAFRTAQSSVIQRLESERAEAQTSLACAVEELSVCKTAHASEASRLESEAGAARARVNEAEATVGSLREELSACKASHGEVVKGLESELSTAQSEFAAYRESQTSLVSRLESEATVVREELSACKASHGEVVKGLESELSTARSCLEGVRSEFASYRESQTSLVSQLQADVAATSNEGTEARNEAGRRWMVCETLALRLGQYAGLRGRHVQLRACFAAWKAVTAFRQHARSRLRRVLRIWMKQPLAVAFATLRRAASQSVSELENEYVQMLQVGCRGVRAKRLCVTFGCSVSCRTLTSALQAQMSKYSRCVSVCCRCRHS